jgi:arsenate reductase
MAEGLLRHYYSDRFEVFSAGTTPTKVHPTAIKVMKEIGNRHLKAVFEEH